MTPKHYLLHSTEDVLQWCARWLTDASWKSSERANVLALIYFNLARYIIRLPIKGQTPTETLSDARKALHTLKQLIGELEMEEVYSKIGTPAIARTPEPPHIAVIRAQRGEANDPA